MQLFVSHRPCARNENCPTSCVLWVQAVAAKLAEYQALAQANAALKHR
jgi:hypothetical protein